MIENILLQKVRELKAKGIVQWENSEVLWRTLAKDYFPENFYFVYNQQELIGLFCVVDFDPHYWPNDTAHRALYIHKVVVLDKACGTGASSFILDEFKRLGKIAKMRSVKLDVRAHKNKLRAYYERNGFVLVRIEDLDFGYDTALYEFVLS
ncbi:MAG: GNAT family N-acetyltransferase [Breznakia sp.]